MHKIAYLFPGQGAQYPGMGKDFFTSFAIARATFEEADDLLAYHLSRIIFEGPADLLLQTQHSQLGIFVMSMALLRTIAQQMPDLKPALCSGLSLGEYSALCAAQKLDFPETLLLVKKRAEWMQKACNKIPGTMAAVLGLDGTTVKECLRGCGGVWVANYNCPQQVVISGTKEGVEKAGILLKEAGAKRVLPLAVAGAFHSGLMQEAQDAFANDVTQAPIQESAIQLVMNVPGSAVFPAAEIRQNLIEQITHSVRWEQGIRSMENIDLFIEIGCGKTLTGLNKKIGVAAPTLSIERVEDLERIGELCNC